MHDAQIRVAIAGAGGRMGRQLIQAALQMEGVALGAALEREGSSTVGSDAGELAGAGKAGVAVQSSPAAVKDDFDVLIDFTRPEGTLNHLAFCREHGKGMVIGTTGFDDAGKQAIRDAAQDIAIVFAANFSVGVNVLLKLLEKAAKVMGDYTDIEIIEAHHRHKVDAPSGTALAMGEAIAGALNKISRTARSTVVKATLANASRAPSASRPFARGISSGSIRQCLLTSVSVLKSPIKRPAA